MNDASVLDIGLQALLLAGKLAGPFLLATLAVGTLIGVVQSATQLQEQTLTFVPKFIVAGLVLLLAGNWMLSQAITFTHDLFLALPRLIG